METPKYLDVKQFAERSGLPLAFIERLVRLGKLTPVVIGKKRFLAASDLERLQEVVQGAGVVEKAL